MKNQTLRALLTDAIDRNVIPSAAYAVGKGDTVYLSESLGYRSVYPEREEILPDTRFDMASLTKLLSTTMVALKFIEEGRLAAAGKHEQLLETCPEYRRMVELQKLEAEGGEDNA